MLSVDSVEKLLQEFSYERRLYDFPVYQKKNANIAQTITFYRELCRQMTRTLNSTFESGSCEIIAYLDMITKPLLLSIINKLEKSGINTKNTHAYSIHSDTLGLPRSSTYIAISENLHKSFLSLPFKMKLRKIIETHYLQIFYIENIEETFLTNSQILDRPLSLNEMRKFLNEIMPIFSIPGRDAYIEDAIFATFIGTQPRATGAGGIGALYIQNEQLRNDLLKLSNSINSPHINIPLQHFGNFTFLDGDVEKLVQRRYTNTLRNLSWNLPYNNNSIATQLSEFKWDAPSLLGYSNIDKKLTTDFRLSLMEYARRSGTINDELYGLLMKTADDEIKKWTGKDSKEFLNRIIPEESVPTYVYNVGSFYSKFGFDSKMLVKFIKQWVEGNAITFGEQLQESKVTAGSQRDSFKGGTIAEMTIREVDKRVYLLLAQTDRTEESLIEIISSRLGYTVKKAEETVKQLRYSGLLREGTNKKLYWWFESGMNL